MEVLEETVDEVVTADVVNAPDVVAPAVMAVLAVYVVRSLQGFQLSE
ncbi:hypothetical protein [Chitinophaga vietnamensis]|nr:hypothetical protein [Chitinophaga vietnamensis]